MQRHKHSLAHAKMHVKLQLDKTIIPTQCSASYKAAALRLSAYAETRLLVRVFSARIEEEQRKGVARNNVNIVA